MNGAMIAPHDCVEKAWPICTPDAPRFPRKVPNVTYHPPQIKNWRNIIKLRRVVSIIKASYPVKRPAISDKSLSWATSKDLNSFTP